MITFLLSILLLIVGYVVYGSFVEKTFGIKEKRTTPALALNDGVDYMPLKTNKNILIQLLNIAGTGPIFGPIMGALYGPVAFVWIVLGSIFAGAVHDYLTGMISVRNNGAHLPELAAKFLGKSTKHLVNAFAVLLLLLVGTVFVSTPASLIQGLLDNRIALGIIILAIFGYYFLATILPVDKIIGRIYPIFGAILCTSAVGIGVMLVVNGAPIPELTFTNFHPDNLPIFPLLFLTISCGALSGFHATQSPIISRTLDSEKNGRKVFYGSMIIEAVIAMIWAAAAMSLFYGTDLSQLLSEQGPAVVVSEISITVLGAIGGTLGVLGVIVLPITSGDTAFRSARMIIADYFKVPQKKLINRFAIAIPLFVISFILTRIDFGILWRYFSWANQSTAVIALFVGAMYLGGQRKNYFIALLPAIFMSMVVLVYIANAQIGFRLPMGQSMIFGSIGTVILVTLFMMKLKSVREDQQFEFDHTFEEAA